VTRDRRTSSERVEDMAFENRIRTLTRERKWMELKAVLLVYGSALDARYNEDVAT
jgi:hypothetical protein